jgi:D-lactate dehydrogenase (cytochrome)
MQFVARATQSRGSRPLCRTVVSRRLLSLPQSTTNPARLRPLSTAAGPTPASHLSSNGLAIALGIALVGLGSYYAGSSRGSASTSTTNVAAVPLPVYGTQEDFKRAIKELEASFDKDVVSTDPANLATHGFSPNVMHEGERRTPSLTPLMLT